MSYFLITFKGTEKNPYYITESSTYELLTDDIDFCNRNKINYIIIKGDVVKDGI